MVLFTSAFEGFPWQYQANTKKKKNIDITNPITNHNLWFEERELQISNPAIQPEDIATTAIKLNALCPRHPTDLSLTSFAITFFLSWGFKVSVCISLNRSFLR